MFDTFSSALLHFFLMLCVPIITILIELYHPTGTLYELLLIQAVVLLYGYFEFLRQNKRLGTRVTIETYTAILFVFILLFGSLYCYMLSSRNFIADDLKYSKQELILPALMLVPVIVEGIEVIASVVVDFKDRTGTKNGSTLSKKNDRKRAISKVAGCV